MTTTEVWKPIEGYEDKYLISNKGNVVSNFSGKTRAMAISQHGNGYSHVCLCKNGKSRTFLIHRLVANHFMEKQEGREFINHKDYNRSNNDVQNLEWCTCKENSQYSKKHMHGTKMRKTNTGEHHISKDKNGGYRVSIGGREARIRNCFRSLEKAIAFRDEILGVGL